MLSVKVCVTRHMFLEDSSSSGELSLCSWGGRKLRYWVGGAVDGAGRHVAGVWAAACSVQAQILEVEGRRRWRLGGYCLSSRLRSGRSLKESTARPAPGTSRSPSPQTPLREGPAAPVGTASASETCLTKVLGVPGSAPGRGVKAQPALRAPSCPRENSSGGWDFAGTLLGWLSPCLVLLPPCFHRRDP